VKRTWAHPELWLVLAIPVATVAAGIGTLRLADVDMSTDASGGTVRRTAQVQVAELAPDREAARRGLSARVLVDRVGGVVLVELSEGAAGDGPLQLFAQHALHADRDLALPLRGAGRRWRAHAIPGADANWRLVLGDADGAWRLVGRLPRGADTAALRPALQPASANP
jgi:hypothetical protein